MMTNYFNLERRFLPVKADENTGSEDIRIMVSFGVDHTLAWEDILSKNRVVIIAEPGTGKTEEFKAVTNRLRSSGHSAFFCRIELLYKLNNTQESFDIGTSQEFNHWLAGEDEAFFFLDSVDESRLDERKAFEIALRTFSKALGERLNHAKVFVSCRLSNWRATADLSLFTSCLPTPVQTTEIVNEKDFSNKTIQNDIQETSAITSAKPTINNDHIVYQLAPLNYHQIKLFAEQSDLENPSSFIEAIKMADANIFAERPQDLIDLIEYWKSHGQLANHAVMLDYNIHNKIQEHNPDKADERPLSINEALAGTQRIAAALTLQKKNAVILPDRPPNKELYDISIDPKECLSDWSPDHINTILDRAIFDEAVYGTVRFHHRTVREYLAAKWIKDLLREEKQRRLVEALIFANKYGRDVIIPSMIPIVPWLALWDDKIRNRIKYIAPEVLIEHGDPSSFPLDFRRDLLNHFAEKYANHKYTGTSFDIMMVRRIADTSLSPTINSLLKKYSDSDDVCILLLKIIWQGKISTSVDCAKDFAIDTKRRNYLRILGIRAVAAAGTYDQKQYISKVLLNDVTKLHPDILGEMCTSFFPNILSVPQLLKIIKNTKTPERYSTSFIRYSISEIVSSVDLSEEIIKNLLKGLYNLIKKKPYTKHRKYDLSESYGWLLPSAIKLANQFIQKKSVNSYDSVILELFLCMFISQSYNDFTKTERKDLLSAATEWNEFKYQLFWHAASTLQKRNVQNNKEVDWWELRHITRNFWYPDKIYLEWFISDLKSNKAMQDRLIALEAIFNIYTDLNRPKILRMRIWQEVRGVQKLEGALYKLLHPKALSSEAKKSRRSIYELDRRQNKQAKKEEENEKKNIETILSLSSEIKDVGDPQTGTVIKRAAYLYNKVQSKAYNNVLGCDNWKDLQDEFNLEVAKNFRDGCVNYWRKYDPFSNPARRTSKSILWPRIIGLSGLAMEAADDPMWATKLTIQEARLAAHYALCELNGFPVWFHALHDQFPDVVGDVIKQELKWELHDMPEDISHSHTLSALKHGSSKIRVSYQTYVLELLNEQEPVNNVILDDSLSIVLKSQENSDLLKSTSALAIERFKHAKNNHKKYIWLTVLLNVDGIKGIQIIKEWLSQYSNEDNKKEIMINLCGGLIDHGKDRFGLPAKDYERIEVLNKLLPLIYKYVKVEDDERHKGVYTPDLRDHAQETRSHLLNIAFDTAGYQSYSLLMDLAISVNTGYLKDRMYYLAKEKAALDAELEPWTGKAVAKFTTSVTKDPESQKDLYDIALARLDDLKLDIEDGDESEAVLLKKLGQETELRTVFAGRLRKASRLLYTIGSEEELADAKRTDIRFNAPSVSAPVPIELKIADNWTSNKLRDRLENQLIKQYMRDSQYGIFLLVHNGKKKRWRNPTTNIMMSFDDLAKMVQKEIDCLLKKYPAINGLAVVGIDLTIR